MDLQRGFESYQTAKINNIKPNAMTFANLLSLTAGFGDQGEFRNGCFNIWTIIHRIAQEYSNNRRCLFSSKYFKRISEVKCELRHIIGNCETTFLFSFLLVQLERALI